MKRKIILLITILLITLSSIVFATDVDSKIINSDLYISEKKQSILDNEVSGNVFDFSSNFELSSSSIINGNLFLVAKNVSLKSDVTYTDSLGKDNDFAIDKINASSTINGNVYVVCNEFTMEPGVEISGDLYIVAKKINIQKSSSVRGNIFATAESFTLNGRIEHSAYIATKSFATNYYSSIYKDLNLSADEVHLNSVIRRNAKIDSISIKTGPDFLIYGNLDVASENFKYSGEVDGNATISSKLLEIVDTDNEKSVKCIIKGDLNYSSEKEIENIETYVEGAVAHSTYKTAEKPEAEFSFKDFILELLTFVLYVFVITWLFTLLNKNYLNKNAEIKVGNTFAALGIGLLAFLVVIVLSILLFIINIGTTLSFALIFSYIFLLLLSTPLFVLDIANLLRNKFNIYLGISVIALVLFLIYQIPFIGGLIGFLFNVIGCGRIVMKLLQGAKK